jgi:putative transposase
MHDRKPGGSMKITHLHGHHFATRRAVMDEIVDWLGDLAPV